MTSIIQEEAVIMQDICKQFKLLSQDKVTKMMKPIKFIFNPSTYQNYHKTQLQNTNKVWQKLVTLASNDQKLIDNMYRDLTNDKLITNLLKIHSQSLKLKRKRNNFTWFRTDYFLDEKLDAFKLIQYNVMATSMHGLSQRFSQVNIACQNKLKQRKLRGKPLVNQSLKAFCDGIQKAYQTFNLQGLFVMITQPQQTNVMDQTFLLDELTTRGINNCKATYQQLCKETKFVNGTAYYKDSKIAVAYYRTGYRQSDMQSLTGGNQYWDLKLSLQLSDCLKIPDIQFELANQKRMQVQLSKKEVYEKYLNQQESKILQKTLVKTWDFDAHENYHKILEEIELVGKDKFILKPNKEGGMNNIFGLQAYKTLVSLNPQERRCFIIMQKIEPKIEKKIFVGPDTIQQLDGVCQISQYGYILTKDDNIIENVSRGYLIRTKPANENQGGIMAGVGAIDSMRIQQSFQ